MSAEGHRFVHTPWFDWIAERGALFTNAYTTNPKCAPSRASIITGLHTWQLEEAGNHNGIFPSRFARYPDLLEESGYHVGFTGKGWAPGDWSRQGLTRNPAGNEYNARRLTPPAETKISDLDYVANFADFLQSKDDQPFCFWYGGREPHRAYVPGEGLRAGKSLDDVDIPPYLPDTPEVRSDLLDYASEIEWFDRQLGEMIKHLDDIGELDNTVVVVTSDNGMPFPRVKGQMLDPDFRLPFAACWPGEVNGGRQVDDLISFVDLAPTFLELAGVSQHPQMVGRSLVGLLRSDRSGWVEPERDRIFMGRERHDVGYEGDRSYPVRAIRMGDYIYVRNLRPDMWPAGNPETGFTNVDSSPTKLLLLDQHAQGEDFFFDLAFAKRPSEELYHLPSDPYCLDNLAERPGEQDRRRAMAEALWHELRATGDPRIAGRGEVFDHYEYVGGRRHSWQAYIEGVWEPQTY